jgi:hypothetical protein
LDLVENGRHLVENGRHLVENGRHLVEIEDKENALKICFHFNS